MAGEWPEWPLGALTENFDSIRVPVRETDRKVGPYPYYGASGIVDRVDGFLFDGEYLLIAEDGENLRTRTTPIAFLARGKFWVNNHAHIVRGNSKADTRFLMYALTASDLSGYLSGSTMPKLTQANLNRIPLLIPSLAEQRRIARILGTLDDKIELNRRMNETLEAMARALFKSWFVDFDPVRAKAEGRDPGLPREIADLFSDSFEDSELGEVPREWAVTRVDAEFDISMGQSPPGDTYNEIGEGLPFHQGRTDFGFRFPTRRVFCTAPTRFANAGDTLISVRAVGDINMANEPCAIGRGVAAARHKSGGRGYTYLFMWGLEQEFARFEAEGTVFGSISKKDFHAISRVMAPRAVIRAFEEIVRPIDDRIEASESESRTLASLRDTLLPKLIAGELRVQEGQHLVQRG
jgi:type I restriction enzyme S subunit